MTLLDDEVARVTGAMVERRRDLHRHPELSGVEHRTAEIVARRCEELGWTVRSGVGGTGVLADLDSGRPGPTLMLRADLDALPVQEGKTGKPWRSELPGVMHACGHDGHVAVLLGVAEVLTRLRSRWSGRVRCCFQPAEENDEGAARMIAGGALDGVDLALGMHLQSGIPTGSVAVGAGAQWAGSETLRITVTGVGGHAGDVRGTVDPVVISAELVLALRELAARDPRASLTITQVAAGSAPNVIPERVELGGTLRALDPELQCSLLDQAAREVARVAGVRGGSAELSSAAHVPVLVCDPGVTDQVREALLELLPPERVLPAAPSTASEDMARYLQEVPGCYFRVGATGGKSTAYPHHHPLFDLDEDALPVAARALVRSATALLGRCEPQRRW